MNISMEDFKRLLDEVVDENPGLRFETDEDRKVVQRKLASAINAKVDIPKIGEAVEEVIFRILVGIVFFVGRKLVQKHFSELVDG